MTNADPSSNSDYDALDFLAEDLEPDQEPVMISEDSPSMSLDEDRLYTDAFIRENEQASRFLLWSVLGTGMICIGVGVWYFFAQNPSQSPQPSVPLQVPEQPTLAPSFNTSPAAPLAPGQALPPTDSGIVPANPGSSNLLSPANENPAGLVTPPPPPSPTTQP